MSEIDPGAMLVLAESFRRVLRTTTGSASMDATQMLADLADQGYVLVRSR